MKVKTFLLPDVDPAGDFNLPEQMDIHYHINDINVAMTSLAEHPEYGELVSPLAKRLMAQLAIELGETTDGNFYWREEE